MPVNYFNKFPKIEYKFDENHDGNITKKMMTDLTVKFKLSDVAITTKNAFYPYTWRPGDRVDSLAYNYYDNSTFYWLVMLSNEKFDPIHDFPMDTNIFEKYLFKKYGKESGQESFESVIEYTYQTIHEYRDSDGDVIDYETYHNTPESIAVSIYDYEFEKNEEKRDIRLISDNLSSRIQTELEKKLNDVK
tara:strand:- start:935 stop:1504 length:570 start_codon:yes stop_codon:yes gene_type:complete